MKLYKQTNTTAAAHRSHSQFSLQTKGTIRLQAQIRHKTGSMLHMLLDMTGFVFLTLLNSLFFLFQTEQHLATARERAQRTLDIQPPVELAEEKIKIALCSQPALLYSNFNSMTSKYYSFEKKKCCICTLFL